MNKTFSQQVNTIRNRLIDTSGFVQDDWESVAAVFFGMDDSDDSNVLPAMEPLAREAAEKLDAGPLKDQLKKHFEGVDHHAAEHARRAREHAASQAKTREDKEALARSSKQLVIGMSAIIGEHTGTLAKWKTAQDPDSLYGYYLEGKPHGLSCAPCGIPNQFMRHEVIQ